MDKRDSAINKIKRIAGAAFKNAVRLHQDAILLFTENRIPSALLTSALSIEEIGKYFMLENVWWQNRTGHKESVQDLKRSMRLAYSHKSKQRWFARQADSPFISKPLLRILQNGELESIKQRATYVGLPRNNGKIDFEKRMTKPSSISKRLVEEYITLVNDFLIDLSVGIREGIYLLDISEIDNWLMEPKFEQNLRAMWPTMRPSTKRRIDFFRANK